MNDLDSAWLEFCQKPEQTYQLYLGNKDMGSPVSSDSASILSRSTDVPGSSDIYISTKTQIAHLNQSIDLPKIFWALPIIPYHKTAEGIIKKQMKFNTSSPEEYTAIQDAIPKDIYTEQHIITHIENPTGRIKFKDVRKISIGLKKSDIVNNRCKKKGAFYNCFVAIIRVLHEGSFKEVHVKVFNTGKLEIPGIKDDIILYKIIDKLIAILSNYISPKTKLACIKDKSYTVLINSNFNCGYYINRAKLYEILRNKYKISCSYDACSYPGIQSIFYYDKTKSGDVQTGQQTENNHDIIKVSFMIFRTGSTLIVGKCDEEKIRAIYRFLVKLFIEEYHHINCGSSDTEFVKQKKKIKKKILTISVNKK